jgi:hypothetical protein
VRRCDRSEGKAQYACRKNKGRRAHGPIPVALSAFGFSNN